MKPQNSLISLQRPLPLTIVGGIWIIFFAVLSFDGYYFYDDYHYGLYAYQIMEGSFSFENEQIFAHRFGFLLPIALLYRIFGINDFSNLLLPIASSVASMVLTIQIAKRLSSKAMSISVLMLGSCFYFLFFSNKLYPDVLLTTQIITIIFLLLKQKEQPKTWRFIPFVLLNVWALLTKELIVFIVPMYLYMAINDVFFKQKNIKFWLGSIIGALLMAVGYMSLYKLMTGEYLYRFTLIEDQHYVARYSYFDKPFSFTLNRITTAPFFMLVGSGIIIVLSGVWLPKKYRNPTSSLVMMGVYFILGSFWWMSTSTRYYNPIGLFPRHILMVLPLAAIITGARLSFTKRDYLIPFVLLLAAIYQYFNSGLKYGILYTVLSIVVVAIKYLEEKYSDKKVLLALGKVGFVAILLFQPIFHILKPTESGYREEKKFFEEVVNKIGGTAIILTDDKLYNGHAWYTQYRQSPRIEYKEMVDTPKVIAAYKKNTAIYLLINQYNMAYFRMLGKDYTQYFDLKGDWDLVKEMGKMSLYKRQ